MKNNRKIRVGQVRQVVSTCPANGSLYMITEAYQDGNADILYLTGVSEGESEWFESWELQSDIVVM
mgnify:CR=1 FL=1